MPAVATVVVVVVVVVMMMVVISLIVILAILIVFLIGLVMFLIGCSSARRNVRVMAMTGPDLLVAAWRTLSNDEREEAWRRIGELRVLEIAGEQSEGERLMDSLRRVVVELDGEPLTVASYKYAQADLTARGEAVEPAHRLISHFGSWRQVKEAVDLSEVTTVRRIEARYASRRLGKVWHYTENTLREVLQRCCAEYGRPVTLAELAADPACRRNLDLPVAGHRRTLARRRVLPERVLRRPWRARRHRDR